MILKNVKSLKCLGMNYAVEYTKDGPGVSGLDGKIETSWLTLQIRDSLPLERKSHTLWHEIIHHISHYMRPLDNGKELTESEIDRLATALNDLEIITTGEPKC